MTDSTELALFIATGLPGEEGFYRSIVSSGTIEEYTSVTVYQYSCGCGSGWETF